MTNPTTRPPGSPIAISWTGLTGSTPRICLRWQAPAEQESATHANIFHSPFPQGAGVRLIMNGAGPSGLPGVSELSSERKPKPTSLDDVATRPA